jgi:pyruvate dehydrogenase E1 component alpha subunit
MNKNQLIKFEKEIASIYEKGSIHAPIHLTGGNENKLIKIFKKLRIKKTDWIFSTHRNHLHWLLSGRNPKELKQQILEGHSMHVFGDRFFTSAIVAGNVSIALGVALALKIKKSKQRVFCFIGDMASYCGISREAIRYAEGFNLPITFIVEDNGLSVNTETQKVWGKQRTKKVITYKYIRVYNHAGCGKHGEKKFILF